MGEVNCRIGKKEVEITHTLDVLKYWNSGKCNSAENRSSKGKSCKAEENKHMDIYETNNWKV